jgi:hypothetical protein
MRRLPQLEPRMHLSDLFPQGTVFAPRSSAEQTKWVYSATMSLDTATGNTITVMGRMPLICHRAVATPQIQEFLGLAGHTLPSDMDVYDSEEESVALALERARTGERLAYIYPPPSELQTLPCFLVPVPEYNFLNDKSHMPLFVDPRFLPSRQLFPPDALDELAASIPIWPVFVKVAFPGASGLGSDVRFCPNAQSWSDALEWLRDRCAGISAVIVEEAVDILTCWCLNVGVLETGCRYLGAAIQLFDAPARQWGSRIDPDDQPPAQAVELALTIAEKARSRGYLGVCGFDIGVSPKGEVFVFDLNFRLNGSTTQLLLHDAATARAGARVSQSWQRVIPGPLEPLLERLTPFADAGRFVPTRFYAATEVSDGKSMLTGFVVADTVEEADSLCARLTDAVCRG